MSTEEYKQIIINADYDGDTQPLTLYIYNGDDCSKFYSNPQADTFINIIDSDILNYPDFLIDGDVFSINTANLFQHLDINSKYILIENDNNMAIVKCTEKALINTLYYISNNDSYICVDDYTAQKTKSKQEPIIL